MASNGQAAFAMFTRRYPAGQLTQAAVRSISAAVRRRAQRFRQGSEETAQSGIRAAWCV